VNKVTPVSLGYPISIFNKNSTLKGKIHKLIALCWGCVVHPCCVIMDVCFVLCLVCLSTRVSVCVCL